MVIRVLLACSSALLLTACGAGSKSSTPTTTPASAKSLFVSQCGACHRLEAAGTEGVAGPDLDRPPRGRAAVLQAIRAGPGTMPSDLVTGPDAERVAAYVARVAGR